MKNFISFSAIVNKKLFFFFSFFSFFLFFFSKCNRGGGGMRGWGEKKQKMPQAIDVWIRASGIFCTSLSYANSFCLFYIHLIFFPLIILTMK